MVSFEGGALHGELLLLKRAPQFLRGVVGADGSKDALDQLDDAPESGETLHAYALVSSRGMVHLYCSRSRKGNASGWYVMAKYRAVEAQPAQEVMADTAKWREWCLCAQKEAEDGGKNRSGEACDVSGGGAAET